MVDWTNLSAQQGYRFWYRWLRRSYFNSPESGIAPGYREACRVLKNRFRRESEVRSPRLKTLATQAQLKHWLNADRFGKWLAENDQEIVGIGSDSCDCPIARYLKDLPPFQGYQPSVGYGGVDLRDLRGESMVVSRSLPDWAALFVREVDKSIHDPNAIGDLGVPKEVAIATLSDAISETK
jgi:hypothetical protein